MGITGQRGGMSLLSFGLTWRTRPRLSQVQLEGKLWAHGCHMQPEGQRQGGSQRPEQALPRA